MRKWIFVLSPSWMFLGCQCGCPEPPPDDSVLTVALTLDVSTGGRFPVTSPLAEVIAPFPLPGRANSFHGNCRQPLSIPRVGRSLCGQCNHHHTGPAIQ